MIADQIPPKTSKSKMTMVSPLRTPGKSRILIVEDNAINQLVAVRPAEEARLRTRHCGEWTSGAGSSAIRSI